MRFGTFLIATLLVLTGVATFMLNLGYGSWQMIMQASELWPILLILLGLSLFWGGRIPGWIALVLVVVLVGGLIYMFLETPGLLADRYDTEVTIGRQQYPGLSNATANIAFGGGKLIMGTDTPEWLQGQFDGPGASSAVDVRNGNLAVVLQNPKGHFINLTDKHWNIQLSPDLTWDLEIDAGALEGQLDFTHVPLKEIDLQVGAGDVNLTLGDNGQRTRVEADAGAAKLTLRVIGDTGVSVDFDGALSQTNLREMGYSVVNGRYVSPNYEEASSKIDVDLDMAVGEFRLETASAIPVAA